MSYACGRGVERGGGNTERRKLERKLGFDESSGDQINLALSRSQWSVT